MCGIIGFTGSSPAASMLLDGLQKLEYRGYDSAGIALLHKGHFNTIKTVDRIRELKAITHNGQNVAGNIGIGHTRWATHGAPSEVNAHPHLSNGKKFAVVHNGIVENYLDLKIELIDEGVTFCGDTDTEVIPNLIAKYYRGDFLKAVAQAVSRLKGSYALGILCADNPDTLIAVKHFSPLIIGMGKENNYIASDITALVSHTKKVAYLNDGEIAVLTPENVDFFDTDLKPVNKTVETVDWDITAAEKGGYDHFMLKEINEQPDAILKTVSPRIKNGTVCLDELQNVKKRLNNIEKISIVACGSAYHAGVVGKYIIERMLRIPTEVDIASEFRYRSPIINEKTLTVIISQSGETADTLAALKEAKSLGSTVLSIVNVVGSSIAKASDDVMYTYAGPEIAVATTKGYTTQVTALTLFAIWAAEQLGTVELPVLKELTEALLNMPQIIKQCLTQSNKICDMAKRSCYINSIFFMGRNLDYASCMEASLKLKEISYIHSEAYAAGELKHGTISLIEHGTTVIALACHKSLNEKLISNIKEVKARGAFVIACGVDGNSALADIADEVIYVPAVPEILFPIVEIVPFQLYAYYVAVCKDCDVDKPRNLAKSVTVE